MIVLGISASFAFTYFSKNRIKSVVGSVLVHEAEAYFLRHPKIISLMREQKVSKDHVKWSKSIGGGRRQDSFECMADVNGIPKGKVTFSGSQSNEGRISYSDFSFEYLGKDKSLTKIDLLNWSYYSVSFNFYLFAGGRFYQHEFSIRPILSLHIDKTDI